MGNDLTKYVEKHSKYVPELNENLTEVYPLLSGGVFVPMSTSTGDLPLHSIPQLILNSKMNVKEYQDCIYDINHYSIDGYSRVRKIIKKMEKDFVSWNLYNQCLEILITNVEQICYDLNEFVLYKYNIIFIPYMNILRDDNNKQHFGIIIDITNQQRKQITKESKKKINNFIKTKHNNEKNKTKETKTNPKKMIKQPNENNDKNTKKDTNKLCLFSCFSMTNKCNDDNIENNNNKNNNNKDKNDITNKETKLNEIGSMSSNGSIQNFGNGDDGRTDIVENVSVIVGNNNNNNNNELNEACSEENINKFQLSIARNSDNIINNSNEMIANFEFDCISSNSGTLEISKYAFNENSMYDSYDENDENNEWISNNNQEIQSNEKRISYAESKKSKFGLQIYLPRHLRSDPAPTTNI